MGDWKTVNVEAYFEVNISNLVNEIMQEYSCSMEDIDREMINEFIDNHTTSINGKNTDAIRSISDGFNISVSSDLVFKVMMYIDMNK